MSFYLVDKLISDFDETISERDTIRLLVRAAAEKRNTEKAEILEAWQETVEWYTAEHARICDRWFNSPQGDTSNTIIDFLKAFEPLEMRSIARVMGQRFLAGLR